MRTVLRALGLTLVSTTALAAPAAAGADSIWTDADGAEVAARLADAPEARRIAPERARILLLDGGALAVLLDAAPAEEAAPRGVEGVELSIPRVGGGELRYRIVDSPILAPELAAELPDLRTFRLVDVDHPGFGGRGDRTMHGFHAAVRTPDGMLYVDPLLHGDAELHQVYYRKDLRPRPDGAFRCGVEDTVIDGIEAPALDRSPAALLGGLDLRTYRLAVGATVEYSTFHGGTVPAAQAAIVTAVNRVNEVYERDLAIRMVLVANNTAVVHIAEPDPYTNNRGGTMLGQNQTHLDNVIGSANYDIGHVFSTGGGGVATLNGPCNAGSKARGVTGLSSPTGDPFYIDYVAHEMGHQWGGRHSFNGSSGSCSGGNRTASSAYEPGSGSTIMAYAGICGAQDLQPNSDAYFHRKSLDEIQAYSRSGAGNGCAAVIADGNQLPVADAGADFTIPKSTPFALVGSATDVDPDALSFCWEQWDLGPAGAPTAPVGDAPIFRTFDPVSTPARTFPRVEDLLDNVPEIGEILPTYARTMHFRLTVRDNSSPAGADDWDESIVAVDGVSGPFLVTAPNTAVTWTGSGPHAVTWDVAGTTSPPVHCSHVDIRTSTDGGLDFDQTWAEHVANDGDESIFVGVADTTTARVQVICSDNIFFDVSNANFTISGAGNLLFADGVESSDTRRWSLGIAAASGAR